MTGLGQVDLKDFALMIDDPPVAEELAADLHEHLAEVPSPRANGSYAV